MKVAVTGASGFVGNHVLKSLLKESVEVVAVTRNSKRLDNFFISDKKTESKQW